MVDHPEINVDVRAHTAEPIEDLRHPVHRDARVGRDANRLRLFLGDGRDLVLELCVLPQKFADARHQCLALARKRDAAPVAPNEAQADLALETVDQMRQPRLRVAHDLRRLRKAPEIHGSH